MDKSKNLIVFNGGPKAGEDLWISSPLTYNQVVITDGGSHIYTPSGKRVRRNSDDQFVSVFNYVGPAEEAN